jgi:molecular chaperone GrpE
MTPFQEELYALFQEAKSEATAFTTEAQDAGGDMQKIINFSNKWDFKNEYHKSEKAFTEYKARTEREKLVLAHQATKALIKELIPVIDDCFTLMNLVEKGSSLERGVKIILTNLEKILTRRKGCIIIPEIGESADPEKHRFIEAEEVVGHIGNTVSQVYRYGYSVLGQIIREAEVKVKCGVQDHYA